MPRKRKTRVRPTRDVFESRCDQMYEELVNQIRSGAIPVGSHLPSESELGRRYSLSRSSVRKVLDSLVDEFSLTRQQGRGILVGPTPGADGTVLINLSPELADMSRSREIETLSQHDIRNGIAVLEKRLRSYGCQVRVDFLDKHAAEPIEELAARLLRDGIVVLVLTDFASSYTCELATMLSALGVKVCSFWESSELLFASEVLRNDYIIGQMGTNHLIKLKHRNIACIGLAETTWSNIRVQAFLDTCGAHGLGHCKENVFRFVPDSEIEEAEELSYRAGLTGYDALIAGKDVTGVFCLNDQIAQGVYEAALQDGKTIPDDLSVVGVDNSYQFLDLSLTTISHEVMRAGEMAAKLIYDCLRGETKAWPVRFTPPSLLLERGSAKAL